MGRLLGRPGRDWRGAIDIQAYDVPLARKLPRLAERTGCLLEADLDLRQAEGTRLPDLIRDMDRAGVVTSLVVLHEETDEFFRLAALTPGRLCGLAYYDSLDPAKGLEQVGTLCENHPDLVVGVTTAFGYLKQEPRLRDFAPLYEYCTERQLPVQVPLGTDPDAEVGVRATALGVLAKFYPRLRFVCRFLGRGPNQVPDILRPFSNLCFQVDGLENAGPGGTHSLSGLRSLMRTVGSHRLLFGSGWRGAEPAYPSRLEMIQRLPWRQRRDICWGTAARVYGHRILGHGPQTQPSR